MNRENKRKQYEKGYEDGYENGKAEIQWIPCSDRLPEGRKDVIVTLGDEFPVIAWYSEVNKQWKNSSTDHVIHGEVTACMLLPEPYKEEETE